MKLKKLLQKKIAVGWVILLLVLLAAGGGYMAYDLMWKTSVCDAQSHPDVAYAFQFEHEDDGDFLTFEKGHAGAVYEVRPVYSPPREYLERDSGWRRVPSGDYLHLWTGYGDVRIYPGEDYAVIRENGGNETRRVEINDCAGSDVL